MTKFLLGNEARALAPFLGLNFREMWGYIVWNNEVFSLWIFHFEPQFILPSGSIMTIRWFQSFTINIMWFQFNFLIIFPRRLIPFERNDHIHERKFFNQYRKRGYGFTQCWIGRDQLTVRSKTPIFKPVTLEDVIPIYA